MGAAAIPLLAAGTVIQAVGQVEAGKAERAAAEANASLSDAEAVEHLRQSKREADIFEKNQAVVFGDQVSSFAKAGVDLSGSALLVLANTKLDIKQEAGEIRRRGERESALIRAGADVERSNAKRFERAGQAGAIGSLLTGAGGIARG